MLELKNSNSKEHNLLDAQIGKRIYSLTNLEMIKFLQDFSLESLTTIIRASM